MKTIKLIQYIFLNIFIFTFCLVSGQSKKPNVVFILADDLGWADLPVYGNPFNEAPNLDKLASEGMRFYQCLCHQSGLFTYPCQYPVGAVPRKSWRCRFYPWPLAALRESSCA